MDEPLSIKAIDSHTGGEPTRLVVDGFPSLGCGTMRDRLDRFRNEFDHLRSAIVCEPRGHDAVVGALLTEPATADSAVGVIFFNNVGYLGMCGHGTIGLLKTLEFMGRIGVGTHKIDTPVGRVEAELDAGGAVSVRNVPSYRYKQNVEVSVPDKGIIRGDIAYGGNWFFLVSDRAERIEIGNLDRLMDLTVSIRQSLRTEGITGRGGAEIDHIELFSASASADSRNFVLCPGLEYDRSPCGTGTSAKLACLFADGQIRAGDIWRQESVVGSIFEGWIELVDGEIVPIIRGTAHVTAQIDLILDPRDPYRFGFSK